MSFQDTDKPELSIGFGTGITNMEQLREAENSLMPKRKEETFGNDGLIFMPRKKNTER